MGRNGKIALLIGLGLIVAIGCVLVICSSVYRSVRAEVAEQIELLPRFDEQQVRQSIAQRYGYNFPVAMPTVPASEISAQAAKMAAARADRLFDRGAVDRAIKTKSALIKPAAKGTKVSFKLKDGKMVEGKIKSVVKNVVDGAIVTVGPTAYKMLSEIDPAFHYLFSSSVADRERLKISAQLRRQYEDQRNAAYKKILQQTETQMMAKERYCYDAFGNGNWIAIYVKIESDRMELFAKYKQERQAAIEKILDENKAFGHRFQAEDFLASHS